MVASEHKESGNEDILREFQFTLARQENMENGETEELRPVKLESVVLNSIRHSFQTLDECKSGKVAKSQLQVLCASMCLDIGAIYDAQHLTDFKHPSTTLDFEDFVEYLQDHLLVKGWFGNLKCAIVEKLLMSSKA